MSVATDIRVPPIFQSHQQLGDFVIPTSNFNSYVSDYQQIQEPGTILFI